MQSHRKLTCYRGPMDLRSSHKVCSNILLLTRGSRFSVFLGSSCCVASVNGPLEVPSMHLDMNKAYVDVIYRPRSGIPGVNERYKEKMLKSLCETAIITQLYPRTQIIVQTQEMDDHGGVRKTCIPNLVSLAKHYFLLAPRVRH